MVTFTQSQTKDKGILPPIRFVCVGDDKKFNNFLKNYLGLLGIIPKDPNTNQDERNFNDD